MDIEKPNIDFLEASRKFLSFSNDIVIKLPRNRKDRDELLLKNLKFTKELTLIISQICKNLHFIKDDVELAAEYRSAFTVEEILQFMRHLEAMRDSLRSAEVGP